VSVAYLLIPLGLGLVGAAVAALLWAVYSGQFANLDEAAASVLDPEPGSPDEEAPGR
jgi:cbb3-type cytochrome oxidase maturation protein